MGFPQPGGAAMGRALIPTSPNGAPSDYATGPSYPRRFPSRTACSLARRGLLSERHAAADDGDEAAATAGTRDVYLFPLKGSARIEGKPSIRRRGSRAPFV
ncbi:hypothetical protein MTO96_021268 [Rhipicephalus appendiculatus]